MKKMIVAAMALVFGMAATAGAASGTWTGKISDSHCGAKHKVMEGKKLTDRQCTQMCVNGDGNLEQNSKYVFVVRDKVYHIANQKDPALAAHAGHTVLLTGDMKDDTITVAKIEMPKADKADKSEKK
jgi:hypothetical protein